MSRVVWLNDGFVNPDDAVLSIDDPGVRFGEGLFETMRGQDGRIPWLERHVDRLERSIAALGLVGMPDSSRIVEAATSVAQQVGRGPARIRVSVTPAPTVLVEGSATDLSDTPLSAISLKDTWNPLNHVAEHKTLSFLGWRDAQRRAEAAGANVALLLDNDGRLGEADRANVFCVIDGELITTPIQGILPGVTRALVMEHHPVRETILTENAWRAAEEMFLTSAVRGAVAVVSVDGTPVGSGSAGSITLQITRLLENLRTDPA